MIEYREDDDMSQAEKEIIINAEIAKLLGKATEYKKIMPSDKYSLETLSEKELGKFIHGQKWPVETTPTKKLKSASHKMRTGQIKPKETKELKSMIFEISVMELNNGIMVETPVFSPRIESLIFNIPDSPFKIKIPVAKLRQLLRKSISGENQGYISIENGKQVFKVPIEINPQLLLDNDEATLV